MTNSLISCCISGDYTIYLVKKGVNKPWNQDAYEPIRISWFMSAKGLEAVLKVVMAHSANDQPLKLLEGMTDIQNSETCQEFQLLFCGPEMAE